MRCGKAAPQSERSARGDMVTLFCAVVGGQGSAFPVDIEASKSVGHLKEAIQKKKEKTITCDPDELKLFLAKKGDAWLDNEGAAAVMLDEERRAVIEDENGRPQRFQHMKETWDVVDYFGKSFKRKRGEIHVLVVVPPVDNELWDEQRARKKAKSLTAIEEENMKSIADALNIDMWHIGGIALAIRHVEPDFPEWFYVRKETLDIIKIFNENMEKKLSTVFVGTPGVGKSMLVVLFAFYMALRQQKRVVLFRKQKGKGFSMLYLDGKHKQYWRKEEAEIADLDLLENRDFELCLDGFAHNDITVQFARLARFRSLATSVQYPMKNDDTPVLRRCLVPFWSKMDLKAIGAHFQWTDHNIKKSYYYSGGNLRDFLSEKNVVIDSIDQAVGLVGAQVAELLNTQYALGSEKQIDRLRMTSVRVSEQNRKNHSRSAKYTMTRSWFCVITSEYALRQLGKIVAPSYYKELWSKGHMLGDDGLMGIAFENYVHTMARDGMKIELLVRAYDRRKKNQHTYAELEFKANSYRYEGTDAAECEAIMKQLADVDYWFPCTRCLETIDSVAKLNMGGRHDVVDLIQITNSDNYKIDSGALDKYVKLFPAGARYIALVPDKETSDKFRLAPADPPTEVPLYVAFVANWSS